MERKSGKTLKIYHIESHRTNNPNLPFEGYLCVMLLDMDRGQARGIARYLHELYPNLSIDDHISYMIRACLRHYYSRLELKKTFPDHVKRAIRQLPMVRELHEAESLKALILKDGGEEGKSEYRFCITFEVILLSDWVKYHFCSPYIGMICSPYSKMNPALWFGAPGTNNDIESSHAAQNKDGVNLDLVSMCRYRRHRDARAYDAVENREMYGVTANLTGSYLKRTINSANFQAAKQDSKRQKAITKHVAEVNAENLILSNQGQPQNNSTNLSIVPVPKRSRKAKCDTTASTVSLSVKPRKVNIEYKGSSGTTQLVTNYLIGPDWNLEGFLTENNYSCAPGKQWMCNLDGGTFG
ncbi:hypothetical protein HDU99_006686, partial [Rhizoclosmatium hyalinum]